MGKTKILIVHPNRLFREGLAFVLDHQEDFRVVGSTNKFDEVLADIEDLQPDALLLDLAPPEKSGLREARRIRSDTSGARILMLGVGELESEVIACIEAGVDGYVPTDAPLDALLENLRAIVAGQALCSPRVARLLFSRLAEQAERHEQTKFKDLPTLTRREREILTFIERGCRNKEIALQLHLELQTVKNHVHNALEKLQLHGRGEAAHRAREWGLLRQGL